MSQTHLLFDQPVITRFDDWFKNPLNNISLLQFPKPCFYKMTLQEKLLNYPRWILLEARTDEKILFVTFGMLAIIVLLMSMFPEKEPNKIDLDPSNPQPAYDKVFELYPEGSPAFLEAICQIDNKVEQYRKLQNYQAK